MQRNNFRAFDLGASSGRAILGTLEHRKLKLTEVHRFENQMQYLNGHYFWNIFSLFDELKTGLKNVFRSMVFSQTLLVLIHALEQILTVSEQSITKTHIIGGGANNRF